MLIVKREEERTTRERILFMLKQQGTMTAREMTAELGLTGMAIRRHLTALEQDGWIEVREARATAGRPSSVYHLTVRGDNFFPKSYSSLTLELLEELSDSAGSGVVDALFESRRDKLLRSGLPQMKGQDLAGRVEELARIQNANGYMADASTEEDGTYVLTELNCPIVQVASVYKQACRCELELFRSLLQADVERTECYADGGKKCTYQIREAAGN
ncbi:winged helix-turn-helix transcriptional regulator [Paenibacillus sp. UMB7766-LJ446]|uniref:helix-turn-helix transcriptional regulator n=1 Tax=Paenibacillus TaxID=44249 RepID=UPI0004001BC4|nr:MULTISPECIES: winged helix-turn-helix transcriptional regulator [Paenibacillus]EAU0476121.1 winged helix-turn-helix transcriptional regulator [Salmonella enterica]MDK8190318.1 winged helix-turn-helix transcriptional regulator [Paenibacillus sp. UMB7766-LJ446]